MKKIFSVIFLITILLLSGCSEAEEMVEPIFEYGLKKELKEHWEYTSPKTTYEPTYDSEYWNYFKEDPYAKMYYEAVLNTDFSDSQQKFIYLFYGDELENYSFYTILKAIQFARFDHPEYELMGMDFTNGSSKEYHSVTYYTREYDEYKSKLDEVNSEIQNLITEVNNTADIVEKHKKIFDWLTNNVTYLKTNEEISTVDFNNEEFILGRMQTDSTQNIYGAIIKKEAICDGIADAYKYICNCCNLECIIVDGYIGNISEKKYHAWNLVKVEDTWYLIDATWELGKDYHKYFMVKDLNKGERTPFNVGYDLPGYDSLDDNTNQITFADNTTKNSIISNEGITFYQEDENYEIFVSSSTIYSSLTSEALDKYLNGEEIVQDILMKTNAEVKKLEYFDYNEALLKVYKTKGNSYIFPERINGTYVNSINVYLEYNGVTYKVKMEKGGA